MELSVTFSSECYTPNTRPSPLRKASYFYTWCTWVAFLGWLSWAAYYSERLRWFSSAAAFTANAFANAID